MSAVSDENAVYYQLLPMDIKSDSACGVFGCCQKDHSVQIKEANGGSYKEAQESMPKSVV